MVKPRMPYEIELIFPLEIVHLIYTYVPHNPKTEAVSPQFQKELQKLQSGDKKTPMYLKGLDDFVLD